MKRADDPRHQQREKAVQQLFAYGFNPHAALGKLASFALKNKIKTDKLIQESAQEWPIEKINRIDLAILRLSIAELIQNRAPQKVVIDEAVELAKKFGSKASPSFINGVLGSVLKSL